MTKPAYYLRGGKPYCPDCAATFFGAPFPVGVLHGPKRECAKCGASVPAQLGKGETMPAAEWTLLGIWDGFEYWEHAGEVFRRKPCADNYIAPDGQPSALRWEGSVPWFERFVAGRLPV